MKKGMSSFTNIFHPVGMSTQIIFLSVTGFWSLNNRGITKSKLYYTPNWMNTLKQSASIEIMNMNLCKTLRNSFKFPSNCKNKP
jgi:hypothetical protein